MARAASKLANTPRMCDVYDWARDLESKYNCSVVLFPAAVEAAGTVGKVRIVAECHLAATGILERFTLRESVTVPASSTRPIEWAFFEAVTKLHSLVSTHAQAQFRLRHPQA